jgi:hypothetical protein
VTARTVDGNLDRNNCQKKNWNSELRPKTNRYLICRLHNMTYRIGHFLEFLPSFLPSFLPCVHPVDLILIHAPTTASSTPTDSVLIKSCALVPTGKVKWTRSRALSCPMPGGQSLNGPSGIFQVCHAWRGTMVCAWCLKCEGFRGLAEKWREQSSNLTS